MGAHQYRKVGIEPGQRLENAIKIINGVFNYCGVKYWLSFGGLWGLVKNDGIIPDGDLDLCVFYGEDFHKIARSFAASPGRYNMSKAILDDQNPERALYCAFSSELQYPHICLSFWYLHNGIRYYCHDQLKEVIGEGVPSSGYWFRGVPAASLEGEHAFRMVEWPGINQATKIRVPRFPGVIFDNMYPDWAYKQQKYNIDKNNTVEKDKMVSYHRSGAISPYAVHVASMADFNNERYIAGELDKARTAWNIRLKTGR